MLSKRKVDLLGRHYNNTTLDASNKNLKVIGGIADVL